MVKALTLQRHAAECVLGYRCGQLGQCSGAYSSRGGSRRGYYLYVICLYVCCHPCTCKVGMYHSKTEISLLCGIIIKGVQETCFHISVDQMKLWCNISFANYFYSSWMFKGQIFKINKYLILQLLASFSKNSPFIKFISKIGIHNL